MKSTLPSAESNPGSYLLWLVPARIVGMGPVALPASHILFGEQYHGDGQQAFGLIIMFGIVGIVAAFVYLAVASVAHFIVRKKSVWMRCSVEAGVFVFFVIALAIGGISAHYSQSSGVSRSSLVDFD